MTAVLPFERRLRSKRRKRRHPPRLEQVEAFPFFTVLLSDGRMIEQAAPSGYDAALTVDKLALRAHVRRVLAPNGSVAWPPSDTELRKRFPRLWRAYGVRHHAQ